MRRVSCIVLILLLVSRVAAAQAFATPAWAPGGGLTEQQRLERTALTGKVTLAVGLAVLSLAVLVSLKTASMCDAYPDPADDCGVVRGLAVAGDLVLGGLGLALTIGGVVTWQGAEARLAGRGDGPAAPQPGRRGLVLALALGF